jgi:hypothetical protein
LRIELLRAHGFSNEDIIARLKSGELPPVPFGEGNVDFTILIEFAKNHWEQAEQAIRSGYRVTFHTIHGIKSLLAAKFGLLADRDYQDRGEFLDEIRLQASDVDGLRSVLADNWCLTEMNPCDSSLHYDSRKRLSTDKEPSCPEGSLSMPNGKALGHREVAVVDHDGRAIDEVGFFEAEQIHAVSDRFRL